MNNFEIWGLLKQKIENYKSGLHVKPREIWWCALGKNIGFEMNGKGEDFRRPVLIFKKVSSNHSIVFPLTTKEHVGKFFYKINIENKENYICFGQIKVIDNKRIHRKMGELVQADFEKIKTAFKSLI